MVEIGSPTPFSAEQLYSPSSLQHTINLGLDLNQDLDLDLNQDPDNDLELYLEFDLNLFLYLGE